jgi:S-adenosylmethionine-diacylglycerol 3-amino-3-carboxypropyl transferase
MVAAFSETLNYTACNEDWASELKALQLGPDDSVLCVTASGDRPLHLLLGDPGRVVSVDSNPLQTQLYRLKAAAIDQLDYDAYAAFLGLRPASDRLAVFAKLLDRSPFLAGVPFAIDPALIEDGILYQGRWERWYRTLARVASLLRRDKITRLFAFDDLDAQRRFVAEDWDTRAWHSTVAFLAHPFFSRHLFGDPGLFTNIDPAARPVGDYFYNRMRRVLCSGLADENFMLSLLFRSHFTERCLPAYLDRAFYPVLQHRINRIEPVTSDIISYLETVEDNTFSAFSTSDLVSHLPEEAFELLLKQIVRTARPGARFCIRQMLSSYQLATSVQPFMRRQPHLEREIEAGDRSFVYRFMVGTVEK